MTTLTSFAFSLVLSLLSAPLPCVKTSRSLVQQTQRTRPPFYEGIRLKLPKNPKILFIQGANNDWGAPEQFKEFPTLEFIHIAPGDYRTKKDIQDAIRKYANEVDAVAISSHMDPVGIHLRPQDGLILRAEDFEGLDLSDKAVLLLGCFSAARFYPNYVADYMDPSLVGREVENPLADQIMLVTGARQLLGTVRIDNGDLDRGFFYAVVNGEPLNLRKSFGHHSPHQPLYRLLTRNASF
jgi:hypothetical protein